MAKHNNKRDRLIQAANNLIHHQGYNATTLADIAKEAGIPLGNVYYYFKSKEEIGHAIIEEHTQRLSSLFKSWDNLPNVKDRLLALVYNDLKQAEDTARFGCPVGSLCQEFNKRGGELREDSSKLMMQVYDWCRRQFEAVSTGAEQASDRALYLLSTLQGMSLLTNTFKDPGLTAQQSHSLKAWLDTI